MADLKGFADEYLAWCEAHQTTPHVNELAATLHLSVTQFSNKFLAAVGTRPSTYLKHQHVRKAIRLIKNTNLSYAAIARKTGFGSRTTLFRAIRRITGRTPASFRR